MSELSAVQKVQEVQYDFPYHYIPQYNDGFSTTSYFRFGINYISTLEFLLGKLREIPFGSVCDVGTGDGRLVRELNEAFPDKSVCGIDYSERAINLARGMNPELRFICADIIHGSPGETFDAVTLMEVFEHIPIETGEQFVKALHGLLNPGGILMVTVPHINVPVSAKHYRHFDSASLRKCFQPWFSVEEEIFFEKRKHWNLFLIRRLLKNKLFLLNHQNTLNRLYRLYKRNCFHAEEVNCKRIYLKLRKV